jgi:capsular polysaccharide transport system ATP-binding protein
MIQLIDVVKFYRIRRHRRVVLGGASMTFEPGHSYALLGVNGAGKSTTIRLLAGTELPNRGSIRRTVRVSWPLGFAGGLHPQMTGVENISFVARAYGEDEQLMQDAVADFAEIGAYLNAPVQTYSSGMIARLAFGLSMAVSFECYLIDEVLGVGDARFQAKCQAEFWKRKAYADVIMASHDMGALKSYCSRGVLLADGRLHYFENVDDAIEMYKQVNR